MLVRTPFDLGLTIRERRKALGLSQGELAMRAGVGRQWLVAVETGKAANGLRIAGLFRTLAALGLGLSVVEIGGPRPATPEEPSIDLDAILAAARKTGS